MKIIKIFFRFIDREYKNETNFFDYFKTNRNINNFEFNNILNDAYDILNHNEYILHLFFEDLINFTSEIVYKDTVLKFVNNESDCDIKIFNLTKNRFSILNVKKNKIYDCGIETEISIPYLTGLYLKKNIEINNKRKYLLSYIGGVWRGEPNNYGISKRKSLIYKLKKMNNELFYAPIVAENHVHEGKIGWPKGVFGKNAKIIYYNSIFSLQPHGDSPTRRGFYEALLCGNIPVISKKSYFKYKNLVIGGEEVKKICIILDDDLFYDADYVINYLINVDNDKLQLYTKSINNIKTRLQWNVFTEENAFRDIINKVMND